jgi:hypothetical protein
MRHRGRVDGPSDWNEDGGWTYEPPALAPGREPLTLALLEDLSRLLVVHGYPPLRGYAVADVAATLQRISPSS